MKIVITEEQGAKIIKLWNERVDNPPSIPEMIEAAFKDTIKLTEDDLDGRSVYAKVVREFLVNRKLKSKTVPELELTDAQKEYIANNCNKMKAIEMTNVLFNGHFSPLHTEAKLVIKHLQSLKDIDVKLFEPAPEITKEYTPPKTVLQAAARVNKYVLNAVDVDKIDDEPRLQECLKKLIKFCHMFRFVTTINNYVSQDDKNLFEHSYVKYIWNKPDLAESELDLICNVCCDVVAYVSMQREEEDLKRMRDECAEDSDGKRISMSIVESIANIRKSRDENDKRQKEAWKNLEGTRNKRIEGRIKENSNILQLFEAWKNEEKRKQMVEVAQLREEKMKTEVRRMKDLDDVVFQIWGASEQEMLP